MANTMEKLYYSALGIIGGGGVIYQQKPPRAITPSGALGGDTILSSASQGDTVTISNPIAV